jgi:hypothetical protein
LDRRFLAIGVIAVIAAGFLTYFVVLPFQQCIQIPKDELQNPRPAPAPPMSGFQHEGFVRLDEVQRKMKEENATFTLRIPKLPAEYKVLGARLSEPGNLFIDYATMKTYREQGITLVMWNHEPDEWTNLSYILQNDGIVFEINQNFIDSNSTELLHQFKGPNSEVKYLWGHPALIIHGNPCGKGSPELYNTVFLSHKERQEGYRLVSSLPTDTLLKMMESVVKNS